MADAIAKSRPGVTHNYESDSAKTPAQRATEAMPNGEGPKRTVKHRHVPGVPDTLNDPGYKVSINKEVKEMEDDPRNTASITYDPKSQDARAKRLLKQPELTRSDRNALKEIIGEPPET